jgi:membrane protein implicated in regulation of membrane protease activity
MSEWEWLHALTGGLASLIFLFQTLGTAGDRADFDSEADAGGGGLADYLSVRNFIAFFIGYGWVTFAALRAGTPRAAASLFGALAGLAFVAASLFLIRTFLKFQEDGSLKLDTLKGKNASVYITIGASGSSAGKVLVDTKTGRAELPARTKKSEPLRPGRLVRIVEVDGDTLWVEEE